MNIREHVVRRMSVAAGLLIFFYVASIGPWLALMNRDAPTNERVQFLAPIYYPVDLICRSVPPLKQLRRVFCNVW